ncbi:MAG: hypothetical protein O2887_16135 [Bacteroidetes bacterium]|nr:hypothetical protein [Bacteroidota bacterium]MDA1121992.1 hypothetical protein [Bacteroidota bacterium]
MKTTIIAALLTVISADTFAKTTDSSGDVQVRIVTQLQTERYTLIYTSESKGTRSLMLIDAEGQILFNEKHKEFDSFIENFGFKELSDRDYICFIESPSKVLIEAVLYLSRADEMTGGIEIISISPNRLVIRGKNLENNDLNIYIYDDSNHLMYEEKIKDIDFTAKIHNMNFVNSKWVNLVIMNSQEMIPELSVA